MQAPPTRSPPWGQTFFLPRRAQKPLPPGKIFRIPHWRPTPRPRIMSEVKKTFLVKVRRLFKKKNPPAIGNFFFWGAVTSPIFFLLDQVWLIESRSWNRFKKHHFYTIHGRRSRCKITNRCNILKKFRRFVRSLLRQGVYSTIWLVPWVLDDEGYLMFLPSASKLRLLVWVQSITSNYTWCHRNVGYASTYIEYRLATMNLIRDCLRQRIGPGAVAGGRVTPGLLYLSRWTNSVFSRRNWGGATKNASNFSFKK